MSKGVKWSEIEVVNIASGQPTLKLYGKAADLMTEKTPTNHTLKTHISLTDTDSLAQAFVVLEAVIDA